MVSSGKVSDFLISRKLLSNLGSQKLFSGLGSYGPAVGLICLSYSGCNQLFVVMILSACVGFDGAGFSGFFVSIFKNFIHSNNLQIITNLVIL